MTRHVGVERDAGGLRAALREIAAVEREGAPGSRSLLNMTSAATLIAAAALERRESRGGHRRSDFPEPWPAPRPTETTLAQALAIRAEAEERA
jgi:L-aspartate oxidase